MSSTCSAFGDTDHPSAPRWTPGERLHDLFEEWCANGHGPRVAVDTGDTVLSYQELDASANQLARHLRSLGFGPGDRIGLLFDRAVPTYVGLLAVLKINAAYVPLDAGFPEERIAYILRDAGVRLVLSLADLRDRLPGQHDAAVLCVDTAEPSIARRGRGSLTGAERGEPVEDLAYIIYTSGSTGMPKGVAIEHASICNFVRVAAETYGIKPTDRVYQGLTIAFDFSIEETWVPWASGATVVPKPAGGSLLGHDLAQFLRDRRITALCCVPTLLATMDEHLPDLRFLLVSGEACPQHLVDRWYTPERRFLNVYGPTETTVTATWTHVHPDRPVTLGGPLPTYSVVILDPDSECALAPGELGEIGIAGIGLASGYVNRRDLTEQVFVPDFLGLPGNPSGRIYRTGDLGRLSQDGEIEYHGRIDTQVKIRGYRIELTEIESVLLTVPGVAQAVVDVHRPERGVQELVAYYTLRDDAPGVDRQQAGRLLRERLPAYMVPAYFEQLATIPMTTSDKADRKNLPAPSGQRSLADPGGYRAPGTETERVLASALGRVLHISEVSADSDFFTDLAADSLLMTRFCAELRANATLPPVSIREVYRHPTITGLAAELEREVPRDDPATGVPEPHVATTPQYLLCAAIQLLVYLGYALVSASVVSAGYQWISAGTGLLSGYLRSVAFVAVAFTALCAVPVAAKWLLIGRWKPVDIPVWSLRYLRFWTVKTLLRASPMLLFAGSPLYSIYLRALGARIGRRVLILSHNMPVCADLLTIGDDTVIRKDAVLNGYRAHAGMIQVDSVTLGSGVLISEAAVLDIGTSMGDGTQLGHASCLPAYTSVPAGQHWHGSPAQQTAVDYRTVAGLPCGTARRFVYGAVQILVMLAFTLPLTIGGITWIFDRLGVPGTGELTSGRFYLDHLAGSAALFSAVVLAGIVVVLGLPPLLNLALREDRTYRLYGMHYSIQRAIARITNPPFFPYLFGDSSYIVYYLRAIGWDLSKVEQTGSNFGVAVKHESPFLSKVGTGTMVSDGLSMVNIEFSSTAFRVASAAIGERNFVGNDVLVPARNRAGANCLLGTKVALPIDGPIREGVGLLGSPCFEIPRTVHRDATYDELAHGPTRKAGLAGKTRHNTATILLYLLMQFLLFSTITLFGQFTEELYPALGVPAIAADLLAMLLFSVGYLTLTERLCLGFRRLRPRFCSIYDRRFWRHERFWKLSTGGFIRIFDGTPFKNLLWRLLGVRIGHRVLDDGCTIPEKTLVSIGSDCTLGDSSVIQCHSLEDGAFKSDRTDIGPRCTIGTHAFIHYGVAMGEGTVVEADSFLMKGEQTTPGTRWQGNPAAGIGPVPRSDHRQTETTLHERTT